MRKCGVMSDEIISTRVDVYPQNSHLICKIKMCSAKFIYFLNGTKIENTWAAGKI